MKLKYCNIYKTVLHIAVENNNVELVKFLLSYPKIDMNQKKKSNIKNIRNEYIFMLHKKKIFYVI